MDTRSQEIWFRELLEASFSAVGCQGFLREAGGDQPCRTRIVAS